MSACIGVRPRRRRLTALLRTATARIVSTVSLTFLCYLAIGLPLPVLPPYVHDSLGLGSVLAGLVISVQYLATLLSRPQAGRMADAVGPKQTVLCGLLACGLSGVLLLAAAALRPSPAASLGCLLLSRLALGFGESWVATGAITWGIGRVGARRTAQVISWNGIATYGALAVGAPVGVALERWGGIPAIGFAVLALGALGFGLALTKPAVAVVAGKRMPFGRVFWRVFPHGMALGLGSAGFGVIATFITLFYASLGWAGAAAALSVFGLSFVGVRLLFARMIGMVGGFPVAILSFAVEVAGLLLLWQAGAPGIALAGAALTGAGFSLVFPALGVEAVALVPASSRGAALGAFSVFLDLALGIIGPLAGGLAAREGYASIFLAAAVGSAGALAIAVWLRARRELVPA
jgi:Major Facilitator Superfamily